MGDPDLKGNVEEHAGQQQPEQLTPAQAEQKSIVDEAVDFLAFVKSYESLQRRAEAEELEFEGIDMWGPDARASRAEHVDESTDRKVPARPALSINLLDQHIQQVLTEARQARLALTVRPRAGLANTKTADYFKGLIRSIQIDSGALEVRLWALERTAKVGRCAYQIRAEYANDGDFDIDLIIERILDQETVYWDPYAQRADRADADRCLTGDWMSEEERTRRWPKKPILPSPGAFETDDHQWFAADAKDPSQRRVFVARFHKVIHTEAILAYHPKIGVKLLTEMPPEVQEAVKRGEPGTKTRPVDTRRVMEYIVDGSQVLEEHEWLGRYIPVIATSGKEYVVKGKRRWKGAVANAMDVSRAINVLISSATEIAATMPRIPYIMYAGQDAGFEEMWDDAPVKNYTRLYVNSMDVDGKPAPFPQRQNLELPIQGLMLLLRMMQDMFNAITGGVPASARAINPYDRSGKAIEALQRQGAAGTSNYLDNLATVSMPYEGKVLIDAIPKYYDKEGRILRVAGEEHDDETAIMLKVPFIRDPEGQPIPVPCPACQGTGVDRGLDPSAGPSTCPECRGLKWATKANMPEQFQDQEVEYVDFAAGEYKVIAVIDRSHQSKQEEALAGMTQLAQAAPNLVPAYAAKWVRAMGFAGANEVADAIELAFPTPGKEFKGKVPPQFVAEYMKLKQEHAASMQALQEAQKLLETDQIKQLGAQELTAIKAAAAETLEQIKQQGRIMEKGLDQQAAGESNRFQAAIETMRQEAEHRHEILLQLLKEKAAKETERHSVELHDAAAAAAAERADLSAVSADARKDVSAERQAARERANQPPDNQP